MMFGEARVANGGWWEREAERNAMRSTTMQQDGQRLMPKACWDIRQLRRKHIALSALHMTLQRMLIKLIPPLSAMSHGAIDQTRSRCLAIANRHLFRAHQLLLLSMAKLLPEILSKRVNIAIAGMKYTGDSSQLPFSCCIDSQPNAIRNMGKSESHNNGCALHTAPQPSTDCSRLRASSVAR